MSDANERPTDTDTDAWAAACEEDLAAERERRRERYGTPPGSAAEELRKLAEAVTGKLAELGASPVGPAAAGAVRQLAEQARAAVEPVVERNPRVFEHLAAAGGELLAAYRAAVTGQEGRWTRGDTEPEARGEEAGPRETGGVPKGPDGDRDHPAGRNGTDRDEDGDVPRGDGSSGSQRIDLD
ncbi:hypothetical protein F0L17_05955 [Streptomyces sp. TRM43335]|uniref:DUF5304 domain-containing protein n=1 Tax=Streptomyces taklimakanensis TaxID=2569853 RepID=A0A6G2B8T3_9ACTN|nr:hypothetical protein [Streptomyces taklimakanensis]